jgi:DNA-binding response OmpR family regulator
MKILIVEDNPLYTEVLKQNLNTSGYSDVTTFSDGEGCIDRVDGETDVILLDYELGEGKFNGIEIFKEIRRKYKQVKIILISSQEDVKVAVEGLKLGAFDYIIKGKYAMDNVLNSLHKISKIKQRQLERQHSKKIKGLFYLGIVAFTILITITLLVKLN